MLKISTASIAAVSTLSSRSSALTATVASPAKMSSVSSLSAFESVSTSASNSSMDTFVPPDIGAAEAPFGATSGLLLSSSGSSGNGSMGSASSDPSISAEGLVSAPVSVSVSSIFNIEPTEIPASSLTSRRASPVVASRDSPCSSPAIRGSLFSCTASITGSITGSGTTSIEPSAFTVTADSPHSSMRALTSSYRVSQRLLSGYRSVGACSQVSEFSVAAFESAKIATSMRTQPEGSSLYSGTVASAVPRSWLIAAVASNDANSDTNACLVSCFCMPLPTVS